MQNESEKDLIVMEYNIICELLCFLKKIKEEPPFSFAMVLNSECHPWLNNPVYPKSIAGGGKE